MSGMRLLEVNDLVVRFPVRKDGLFGKERHLYAVDGVSFSIARGRTLGLVGESGSGKSTTALAVARLIDSTSGAVRLGDDDLLALEGAALREARRHLQFVFQDPYSALNPRLRASDIVREPLERLDVGTPAERKARVDELFIQVGLRPELQRLFPHQFSGGQRQRLGVARALASRPDVVICDEPVSALDVAVQAQILNLLRRLQRELGLTYLFISHDLGVVQHMCDDVAVMYLGKLLEVAPREQLFRSPGHPYTRALLEAVPSARLTGRRKRAPVRGDPPSPVDPAPGCRFVLRCEYATERCRSETPRLRAVATGSAHAVACHFDHVIHASGKS